MIDIKAVYSSDAFSLVNGPSSAIASISSIAEYGQPPIAFHHIVAMKRPVVAMKRPALARLPAFRPVAHAAASTLLVPLAIPARRAPSQALRLPPALADAAKTLNVAIPRQVPD
jgi:hypothetical protein